MSKAKRKPVKRNTKSAPKAKPAGTADDVRPAWIERERRQAEGARNIAPRGAPAELAEPLSPIAEHRIDRAVVPRDRLMTGVLIGMAVAVVIVFGLAALFA